MIFRSILRLAPAVLIVAGACATARAQAVPPPPGAPPAAQQSPACTRLESQLGALDRGQADPVRSEQVRRYEEATGKQQAELDRLTAQARRNGCESSGFFLFGGGGGPQCGDINGQIERMRANLARMTGELQHLQSGGTDRGEQRRALLIALGQNDCGPQYVNAVPQRPRGFFETLFGGPAPAPSTSALDPNNPYPDLGQSAYRTLCVRTCDGFYYPISFSTSPSRFADDERVCQRTCPAAEVMLFSHRNPGEDVAQAVSISGKRYADLPTAFHYRQEYTPTCSCRRPGQSWADALGARDETLERGDIVVTEERAKAMSQPKAAEPAKPAKQGKGKPEPKPDAVAAPEPIAVDPAEAAPAPDASRIRTVGPQFIPPR
ncbi:MAG: DUF2865 domain-containing protein [Xanthobacteraceae bacterium]|jgi:hypothetical protein